MLLLMTPEVSFEAIFSVFMLGFTAPDRRAIDFRVVLLTRRLLPFRFGCGSSTSFTGERWTGSRTRSTRWFDH